MEPFPTFLNLPREKQDRIFRVALNEFGDKGYQGASINAMIKDLGIAKGSIYQYFSGKDGLFLFVFTRTMETVKDHLRSIRDRSHDNPLSVRLKMILDEGVRFIENHPEVYTLYITLLNDRTMPMREDLLNVLRSQGLEYIHDFLVRALERGELRPGIDIQKASFMIDAVMDRFLLSRTIPHIAPGTGIFQGDAETIGLWIDDIVSMLCQGVVHA